MQWSIDWLSDFVDLDGVDPKDLGEAITLHTAEVDGVLEPGGGWPGVVVGLVVGVRPHPDADKLRLVRVDHGQGEAEVVCGAPNVAEGLKICYGGEGTVLPGGFTLERRKIRGVESAGMVLSERELGISDEHEGILVLADDAPVGTPVKEILGGSAVIDVDNTAITTRPDLWGHYGAAREVGAILDRSVKPLPCGDELPTEAAEVKVTVEAPELCPRYLGWVIDGIEIAPSPEWMQRRLEAVGQRPINNVVDLTNYIQLECGQPLHAFDLRQIADSHIVVRAAGKNEKVTTLDGMERTLPEGACVIADPTRAVAIAGVMGLENSEVKDDTTAIILEVANFEMTSIRRTSQVLNLRTDSSTRFSKGLDIEQVPDAARRFFELLKQMCPNASPRGGACDVRVPPEIPVTIDAPEGWIDARLGVSIGADGVDAILHRLGFSSKRAGGRLETTVPTWRARDVAIPEDLVEEVGRIFGYDKIAPEPLVGALDPVDVEPDRAAKAQVRSVLSRGCGLTEIYAYPVYSQAEAEKTRVEPGKLAIVNWEERGHQIMAESLIPLMVRAAAQNLKYRSDFGMYCVQPAWAKREGQDGLPSEDTHVGIAIAHHRGKDTVLTLKGMVERVIESFGAAGVKLRQQSKAPAWLHEGRAGDIGRGKQRYGWFGELHPAVKRAWDIDADVAVAEFDLEAVCAAGGKTRRMQPISRFPVVPYDVAIVADARTPADEVERALRGADKTLVRDVSLFDVYAGKNLPDGKRSLAYKIVFGAMDRTLGTEEVDRLREGVARIIEKKGWELRQ
ncbi:MAG: phenylalanine--tRNA ligase subunit beta [Planctomycetota bacterium]|jgi:phenylalanyl-tRNA synthetase beta chain